MNEPKRKLRRILIVAVATFSAVIVAFWLFIGNRDAALRQAEIVVALSQVALKHRGIGYLENGDYGQADAAFSKLVEQLPGELLGPRNLAIGRLLATKALADSEHTPEQLQAAIDSASVAIGELLNREPDSPLSHLLAAELANRLRDESQFEMELSTAAELAPTDATIQFKLYLALQYSRDDARRQRAHTALGAASTLAPENVWVLIHWLSAQAAAKDPRITETLKRARRILSPFAAALQVRSPSINVLDAIDQCLVAVETEDWPLIIRKTANIGNVVKPEPMSHIDDSRINRHLLEYVVFDFSDTFYGELELPPPPALPSIDVKFVDAGESLPDVKGVRDLELADFDLDGDVELIVLTDAGISVWERNAEAKTWKSIASFDLPPGMRGFVVADLDRDDKETPPRKKNDIRPCLDADIDIIVYGEAGILVLQNKLAPDTGTRTLEPMPQDDALGGIKQVLAVALFDVDHDGDLDLAVSAQSGMSIWSNRDDLTFADISNRSALPPSDVRPTKIIPVDWNRDVAIDLVLADAETGKVGYLENLMHGSLRWRAFGRDFNLPKTVASIVVAELDGNASWDLIAAGEQELQSVLTTTPSNSRSQPVRSETLAAAGLQHLLTWDYDNDGFRDLLGWNGDAAWLFRGLSNGRFQEASSQILAIAGKQIADCATGDVDGDGDLDVVAATGDGIAFYRNDGGNTNGWIDVALSADPDKNPRDSSKRVNMHGIGSLLELKAGNTYQAQVVTGKSTHFGIGSLARADVLRILWTNGVPENRIDPARNTAICAKQDLKGSCPYLYTWDGERFTFMTDLLWSSPIGLQFAEGVLAPAREWEYLRIPGDRLQETDGEYRLQVTEELWEAAYFDRVQLIAVDHPADIDIYTNEKVGPAQIAMHKIHTVRHPRIPASAHDKQGRDVLASIARRDDKYLKAFDGRVLQGLTDEHFIELDLGKLDNPQRIMLFLTGWVFPTDTSLNVAISQNPNIDPPRPPFIQVPNGKGGWREAIPYTGFPGGKTKTIAIDISDIFPTDDYRLRLTTSMQLCWDQIFFTVDEKPEEVESTELPLIAADLHFRGFNRRVEHPGNGPESYDYNQVDTNPKWPPMAGRFTRYGDVAALLRTEDDQLVVMGSGDEMTIRFRAPDKPLPSGWRRDFILYNVGWDKDTDLNTVYGQTVEPLPFRAMRRYPIPVDQPAPDTPEYHDYLQQYQTRTQDAGRFWKALVK
jgi:Tfp pilus assembly protein PilF